MLSIGTDMSKATFHAALDDLSFANSRTQRERGLKRSGSAATSRSPNGLSAGTGAQWSPSGKDDQDDTRQGAAPVHLPKPAATDAAVHDSQKLDDVLDLSNTGNGVWADSAYRSVQIEAGLTAKGLQSHIHRRAARNRPLSERQKSANTTRSRVRARVEHVFGHQQNSMGGKIVRTIGIARARFKIGMMNLGYNIRRLVQLERLAAVPA